MIQKISLLLVVILTQVSFAQKAQKIGFIDSDYILENVPEYITAQSKLDTRIKTWNTKLGKLKNEIGAMKLTLSNEKALLTSDLIADREEDIIIKQADLKKLQEAYYGTSGDLFMLRKQLVAPIQDQIFNAVQEISKNKKYDLVFDKSSKDMVMLFNNPKFDISELVLSKIVKGRKTKAAAKKRSDKQIERDNKKEALKDKAKDRKTKNEILRERIQKQKEAKIAKRAALKKANEEKRAKRKEELVAKREALKNKGKKVIPKKEVDVKDGNKKNDLTTKEEKTTDTKKDAVKTKAEIKAEKRKQLVARAIAKKAKRDSLRKVATDKRAKKIAEIEARKKKLKESKQK